MKSPLAKARDKWFVSDDGKECCKGQTSGQYLQNRLERAFLAGAKFSSERIKELESTAITNSIVATLLEKRITEFEDGYRQIRTLNAGKDNDIDWLCEQALKGGD